MLGGLPSAPDDTYFFHDNVISNKQVTKYYLINYVIMIHMLFETSLNAIETIINIEKDNGC